MEHQISIITLGVNDPEIMMNWYKENFGWTAFKKKDETIFFRLDNLILMLIHENELAKDMYAWQDGNGFKQMTLTIGFNSEKELDKTFQELQQKGVTIIKEPQKTKDGIYRACVSDPEGNYWELAFYPFVEISQTFPIPEIIYQS